MIGEEKRGAENSGVLLWGDSAIRHQNERNIPQLATAENENQVVILVTLNNFDNLSRKVSDGQTVGGVYS